ncbi:MAG TPA: hypothetical protein VMH83_06225 [Candidatus Acidoferrum sp.]|nr:hypothetical protein [Candidatus Acidoferrum sp.]
MKLKLNATAVLAIAGVAAALYLAWKAKQGVAAVATAINPASADNIVNQGMDAVVSEARGRDSSLGAWVYDMLHPDEFLDLMSQ